MDAAAGGEPAQPAVSGIVATTGKLVAIQYLDPTRSSLSSYNVVGPYLNVCGKETDWLCAAAASRRNRNARFVLLPLLNGTLSLIGFNASLSIAAAASDGDGSSNSSNSSSSSSISGGSWFALRSVRTGKLVQVADADDEEAWVIRARGEPTATEGGAGLRVGALELWREDGEGLRNLGTGSLLNYRGDAAGGDGGAVRAHGDTKPRRPCRRRTPQTRFAIRRVKLRSS